MIVITRRRVLHKLIGKLRMIAPQDGTAHAPKNGKGISIVTKQFNHRIGQWGIGFIWHCHLWVAPIFKK